MALLTISRHKGCHGIEIAQMVAKELELELYDDARLRQEALQMGLKAEELKGFDTEAPGFFDRIMRADPQLYLDLMASVIYEVAKRCHGVIIGHGSQKLLRSFDSALHVHIYGTMKKRIQRMMDEQGLSAETAEKLITKSDNKRKSYIRYTFHEDWDNPKLYDLIINRDKMLPETAAGIIVQAARSDEISSCGINASESMEKLSLIKKVEAEIIRNDFNLNLLHVEAPEQGVVKIWGYIVNLWGYTQAEGELDRFKRIVQAVPGVREAQYDVAMMNTEGE